MDNTKQNRKFTKVKGYPGIYKVHVWDDKKKKYIDPKYSAITNAKSFRACRRVRVQGKSVQQIKYFSTLADAKTWRTEFKPEIRQKKNSNYTLEVLIADWREWSKPPRFAPSSWQKYGQDTNHLKWLFSIPVEDLTAQDIDQWLSYVIGPQYPKPKSRVSFLRELKALTTILNWYREYKNPSYQSPLLKRHREDCYFKEKPGKPDLSLSEEDLERFLNRLKNFQNSEYYYLASFQALTGCRIGEVCGLKWESINFDRSTVNIQRTCYWDYKTKRPALRESTKTGERRTIVLPPRLITLLKEWKAMTGKYEIVFHKRGQLLRYNAIQSAYKKAFKALGLPERSTHVLRHTFASIFSEQTGDIRGTQAALGHRDLRITQHYAKVGEKTQRKVMHKFELGQDNKSPSPEGGGKIISLFNAK